MMSNSADQMDEERGKREKEFTPLLQPSDDIGGEKASGVAKEKVDSELVNNSSGMVNDMEETVADDREGSAVPVVVASRKNGDVTLDDYFQMGWYMLLVCLLSQLLLFAEVGDLLFMTFAGAEPKVASCGDIKFTNETVQKRCDYLKNVWASENESKTLNCFNSSITANDLIFQFQSINVDFGDLYCNKPLVKLSQTIQLSGIIPGSFVFGWLSDVYGRRAAMFTALVLWIFAMAATSFTESLIMFTVLRFIVCFFNAGIAVTLIVFTSELYPKKHRFCLMNLITWAPNYILFGILASFIPQWQQLQRVLALSALPCIPLIIFLNESPRFLIGARRMKAAKEAIVRMHKFDCRPYDEKSLDELLDKELQQMVELSATKKKYNYLHLFYNREFALYTVSVSFSLLVVTLITYALVFDISEMYGDIFLNMIWMGAFKYTMNLAIAFADFRFKWLGRKMSHLISELLVIGSLGLYVVLRLTGDSKSFLANPSLIAAVGFCGVLFNADKLAGSELFPTGVRNLSCSFGQICSRFGVVGAPLFFTLKELYELLPHFTLLVLAALDAVFFQLIVRETKGKKMLTDFPG